MLLVRHVLDGVSLGHFACKRVPVGRYLCVFSILPTELIGLGDNHDWLEKVLKEVQLLQQLSHTNLVSYRHVWLENIQITSW